MVFPNLIIAGAPKAGTSSLFNYLASHPEVGGSSVKETRYFIDKGYSLFPQNNNYYKNGFSGYEEYFSHLETTNLKVILEATPDYLYQSDAIHLLNRLPVRPKILFILRAPPMPLT